MCVLCGPQLVVGASSELRETLKLGPVESFNYLNKVTNTLTRITTLTELPS